MALANGSRLGPSEIASAIGAGGVGEVYRERDRRLDRYVAVKTLQSHPSCNPELKSDSSVSARAIYGCSASTSPRTCVRLRTRRQRCGKVLFRQMDAGMAYMSNESGHPEIYLEPVSGPGGRRQISIDVGEEPRWVRNGREIIFRRGTRMMSVPVQVQPTFQGGKPIELFDRKFDRGFGVAGYDVTVDGQTFVMTRSEHSAATEIRVVTGWPGEKPLHE